MSQRRGAGFCCCEKTLVVHTREKLEISCAMRGIVVSMSDVKQTQYSTFGYCKQWTELKFPFVQSRLFK
jgi:hypothetical protein